MKQISESMRAALESGRQISPAAMLKVDIDPPFVGQDFRPDCCDPYLFEYGGVLYLSLIEDGKIKILIVDPVTQKVTGQLREITAPNARRPRLAFEISNFPGKPDLPHIAYTNPLTGKAMVYREQYDSEGNVVIAHDEIGNGCSCEAILMGNVIINFYVGADGILYQRVQGEYAEPLIDLTASGDRVTSVSATSLPDGRFAIVYTVAKANGGNELKVSWSELFGATIPSDTFSTVIGVEKIEFRQGQFVVNDNFEVSVSVNGIACVDTNKTINDYFDMQISVVAITLSGPQVMNESFSAQLEIVGKVGLLDPKWLNDTFQVTLAVTSITLE